ncbi:ParB/RepB/Spo0J family partition protein (plasmid) [Phormidium sp. CLA17]|uniref:ParB/RepB/Spo0J family partition protein n=1 Tax=Leptolyngbya sp. Cla-17 TaxID=2803751 RepID=UPI0014926FDF|nr:ParB/RepB/Spo0J family partition protein [Leptolyngbya sp. Cla-17]MBM0745735.1 ParB/RepB/Spo0J family partition protein [Leptolyngbya sp. Cla-17]
MTTKRSEPYGRQIKGIDLLFGKHDQSTETGSSVSPVTVPIDKISLPNKQPRRYFDPQKMEQLTLSVIEHGILEPLLVRSLPNGLYELVAGERRFRASQSAQLAEVPVVIRELADKEALQIALIENLQREDLNPVEEAEGILQLLEVELGKPREEVVSLLHRMRNEAQGRPAPAPEHNVMFSEIIKKVFTQVGVNWTSFVTNRLSLLNLPLEILEALRRGQIAYTKAQSIARVKDEGQRQELLKDAITQDLSLIQIKERIASLKVKTAVAEEVPLKSQIDDVFRIVKRSKIWDDPKKQKKLEQLLVDLRSLVSEVV